MTQDQRHEVADKLQDILDEHEETIPLARLLIKQAIDRVLGDDVKTKQRESNV